MGRLLMMMALVATSNAHAQPRHGQTFEGWKVHCEVPKGKQEEHCFIFQNVVRKPEDDRLVHFAAGYLTTEGRPAAIVTLPLGVFLPAGVGITVDGQELAHFGFERCDQKGCFGVVLLNEQMLNTLRSGKEARVSFQDGNRNKITAPISLPGFGAGFQALQ